MDASLRCRFVQHDKLVMSNTAVVIPSQSEESIMDASLRCRFVQHDKLVMSNTAVVIPSQQGIYYGCFTSLTLVQHDKAVSFRTQ